MLGEAGLVHFFCGKAFHLRSHPDSNMAALHVNFIWGYFPRSFHRFPHATLTLVSRGRIRVHHVSAHRQAQHGYGINSAENGMYPVGNFAQRKIKIAFYTTHRTPLSAVLSFL